MGHTCWERSTLLRHSNNFQDKRTEIKECESPLRQICSCAKKFVNSLELSEFLHELLLNYDLIFISHSNKYRQSNLTHPPSLSLIHTPTLSLSSSLIHSPTLSPSLFLVHTHTPTQTLSLSVSYTLTHPRKLSPSLSHTQTNIHTNSLPLCLKHKQTPTQTLSLSLSHTHTHTHMVSISHTHTHTHYILTVIEGHGGSRVNPSNTGYKVSECNTHSHFHSQVEAISHNQSASCMFYLNACKHSENFQTLYKQTLIWAQYQTRTLELKHYPLHQFIPFQIILFCTFWQFQGS